MALELRLPDGRRRALTAVICDMDGLLVASEALSTAAWRAVLAGYGVRMTDADVAEMFGLRIDEDAALLIARYRLPANDADLAQAKTARMLALVRAQLQPMPGALAFVGWLQAGGVPHALATSGLAEYAAACLDAVGLGAAFPVRVTGDAVPRGKPAPDIFLEAARRLAIAPAGALVLEDAPNGVAAALAAGMPVIAIPNAETRGLPFPAPTAFAGSLAEAQSWLALRP